MRSQNEAHGQHGVKAATLAMVKWVDNLHGVPRKQTLPREAVVAAGARRNKLWKTDQAKVGYYSMRSACSKFDDMQIYRLSLRSLMMPILNKNRT